MGNLSLPILIVEDNAGLRAALASLLNFTGYTTVTARNAEEALDHLRGGGTACLIILDLGLPGMDGATFRAALLADPVLARIPVIIYSGQDGSEVPGIFGHVRKTAEPDMLLSLVAKACEKGSSGRVAWSLTSLGTEPGDRLTSRDRATARSPCISMSAESLVAASSAATLSTTPGRLLIAEALRPIAHRRARMKRPRTRITLRLSAGADDSCR